ncbi:M16 family metallopeptidase [Lacimicrobium alkaliphilum]|uniref:Peptidase M16 n=1 Tax=Lacimicrobium alkaliphilum TaxID=1526571 RepID=A0ABQ1R926_9ALTE|nr:pitrilysin family protein [Lacimicrobium alkaliphilum]GGD62674.1 peptidase M16 [Lacimicrobium alkaliphilum]
MNKWKALIVATLLATFGAQAEKQQPPAGGEPKDFKLTETYDFSLDNGLEVTFVQYGDTPKATLRLVTATGNVDDGEQDAVSDLAYELLTEGTTKRSAREIAEQAAGMGGQVNTSVSANSSYVQMDVLSEYAADAASLIADLVQHSEYAEEDLQRAKNNFIRDLKVQKSQAQGQAAEAFYSTVYPDHPYGDVFADESVVETLGSEEVKAFMDTNLVATRSHLYVSGKFDPAKVEQAVKAAFSDMAAGEPRSLSAPQGKGAGQFVFVPRENAPQSTLRLGLPVVDPSHPDYVALGLMNTLLGGSFSSRITSNIREDKGYTYSPGSTISARVKSGTWFQTADVTAEATGPALAEIIKEIKLLQTEAPSQEELQGFKNYISGIYVLQNSSRTAIINQLWFLKSHGLPLSRLETYVQQINAVTPGQISSLAAKYLPLEKMTLVVVGDESVKSQLTEVPELKEIFKL